MMIHFKTSFVRGFFTALCFLFLSLPGAHSQDDLNVLQKNWVHFSDAPNSLYKHLSRDAFVQLKAREAKVADINSLDGWKERQQFIKKQLNKVLGPFPPKSPLNARITRTVDKEDYKVEHVVFESQPNFFVSSSLFIPQGKKGRLPVIIYCSGHAAEGYRSDTYQHVILNLVKKGFAVFAFDPVGQGERLEYFDGSKGKSLVGGPTKEHSYPGAQAFIAGQSQALYMVWDGIRAVDYLLTRKEIDPARIGITGRSGGGTQSAYVAAIDERIHAVAPENYITNFTRLFQTNGPQDAEQNFLHGIAEGLDHPDLLLVRAPKPALMITTTRDIFSIQGARETAEEVSRIYSAYDQKTAFGMVEDDAAHASTLKNREAMYAFFQKHLNQPGNPEDEKVTLLTAEEIQVTQTGQIATSYEGETVFSLNKKMTEKQAGEWQNPDNGHALDHGSTVDKARQLSGYIQPEEIAAPVLTGRLQRAGYVIEKYYVKGEGDYIIPYLLAVPEQSNGKALIYIHPAGKSAEASAGGEIEGLAMKGFTVLAPDLLGIGEVGPQQIHGDSNFEGNSYNIWYASVLVGRSIAGVHAGDIVRLALLLNNEGGSREIYGIAKREMAPALLHAASFEPSISRVALVEPLISYNSLVNNRFYAPEFIQSAVPAALTAYDLPHLAAALAPKKLLLVNVLDGTGNMADPVSIIGDISALEAGYQKNKGQLQIIARESGGNPLDNYREWLE